MCESQRTCHIHELFFREMFRRLLALADICSRMNCLTHPALLEMNPRRAGVCKDVPSHGLDRGEHGHRPGIGHALVY